MYIESYLTITYLEYMLSYLFITAISHFLHYLEYNLLYMMFFIYFVLEQINQIAIAYYASCFNRFESVQLLSVEIQIKHFMIKEVFVVLNTLCVVMIFL